MKKIAIVTDDSAGFTKEELNSLDNVYVLGMPTLINGEEYYEGINLTSEQFYKFLDEDKDVKTSQPAPGSVISFWENLLNEYEYIIHIPLSGGLSESCNSAKMLAQNYNGRVLVVDNHRVSVTLKRSIYDALNLIKEGKSALEIYNILEETKSESTIYIMVDTLKYLKKGGRVTAAGAALGSTLHIKPVLAIFGGKLDAKAKALGVKKAKSIMIEAAKNDIANRFNNKLDEIEVDVAYTYDIEKAIEFKDQVEKELGIKVANINPLALLIATHIGPGAIAIAVSKVVK